MLNFSNIKRKELRLTPRKKQKLESEDPATSCVVEENAEVGWKILEEMPGDDAFHDDSATKNQSAPSASPRFNGVSKMSKLKGHKYEARFSSYRLGSYVLKADAALAYDGFVRSSGKKKCISKINFKVERDYLDARESESSAKGGTAVDLEEALNYISSKVNTAVSKTRRRA